MNSWSCIMSPLRNGSTTGWLKKSLLRRSACRLVLLEGLTVLHWGGIPARSRPRVEREEYKSQCYPRGPSIPWHRARAPSPRPWSYPRPPKMYQHHLLSKPLSCRQPPLQQRSSFCRHPRIGAALPSPNRDPSPTAKRICTPRLPRNFYLSRSWICLAQPLSSLPPRPPWKRPLAWTALVFLWSPLIIPTNLLQGWRLQTVKNMVIQGTSSPSFARSVASASARPVSGRENYPRNGSARVPSFAPRRQWWTAWAACVASAASFTIAPKTAKRGRSTPKKSPAPAPATRRRPDGVSCYPFCPWSPAWSPTPSGRLVPKWQSRCTPSARPLAASVRIFNLQ